MNDAALSTVIAIVSESIGLSSEEAWARAPYEEVKYSRTDARKHTLIMSLVLGNCVREAESYSPGARVPRAHRKRSARIRKALVSVLGVARERLRRVHDVAYERPEGRRGPTGAVVFLLQHNYLLLCFGPICFYLL